MTSWSRSTTKDNTSRPDYGTSMRDGSERRSFQTSRQGRSSSFPRDETTGRNGASTRDYTSRRSGTLTQEDTSRRNGTSTRDYTSRQSGTSTRGGYTTTRSGTSTRGGGGYSTTRDEESGLAPRPPKRKKSLTAVILIVVSVLVVATVVWVVVFKTEDDSTQGYTTQASTTPQVQAGLVIQSCGNIEQLKRVLKDKARVDIDERDPTSDETCLMTSASAQRLGAINVLIANGANLDLTWSSHHKTALHEAVWAVTRNCNKDHPKHEIPNIVKALLKAGASRDVKDYSGKTPAAFATAQNCASLGKLMNNFKDSEVDECALNSVYKCNKNNNGGTCVDEFNRFSCDCSAGFSGSTCSIAPTTTTDAITTDTGMSTTDIILMAAGAAVCLLMVGAGVYYFHHQQRKQAEERLRLERELENEAVFGTSRQSVKESTGSRGQSPSRLGVQHSRLSMSQMSKSQFSQPSRTYMSKSQVSQPSRTDMSKSQVSQPTRSYMSSNQLSQPTTSFTVSNSQSAQQSDSRHY